MIVNLKHFFQVILHYKAVDSFVYDSNNSTALQQFLVSDGNLYKTSNQLFGLLRLTSVRLNVTFVLLITVMRFVFTYRPLKSLVWACSITIRKLHMVLVALFIFIALLKTARFLKSTISNCSGLLVCEDRLTFHCDEMTLLRGFSPLVSLTACGVILALVITTWSIARRAEIATTRALKTPPNFQSSNYKAVKTSIAISVVFLFSNIGPIVNNLLKVACVLGFQGEDHDKVRIFDGVYYLADQVKNI